MTGIEIDEEVKSVADLNKELLELIEGSEEGEGGEPTGLDLDMLDDILNEDGSNFPDDFFNDDDSLEESVRSIFGDNAEVNEDGNLAPQAATNDGRSRRYEGNGDGSDARSGGKAWGKPTKTFKNRRSRNSRNSKR